MNPEHYCEYVFACRHGGWVELCGEEARLVLGLPRFDSDGNRVPHRIRLCAEHYDELVRKRGEARR